MSRRLLICGGGISGLTTAYQLKRLAAEAGQSLDVTVLEAASTAGGKIRSHAEEGFVVEEGPNGFLDSRQPIMDLIDSLGLTGDLLAASPTAGERFVLFRGSLHPVPTSPTQMLRSRLLSLPGKLRLGMERFVSRGPASPDETVAEFGRRRIGHQATARLLDPAVTGIFAGDIEQTSMAAAFPRLVALEREHGSLMRALGRLRRERRRSGADGEPSAAGPSGTLTSFREGMAVLTEALAKALPSDSLVTGARVGLIERNTDTRGAFRLRLESGDELFADEVVSTAPAHAASGFLGGLKEPGICEAMAGIPYAPAAVVALGFRLTDLGRAVDGFGFLVPSSERPVSFLGVTWCHSIFPGHRAPTGHVLLRAVVGGQRSPELVSLDDEALLSAVAADLCRVLGVEARPVFSRIIRWPRAIPQYVVGHRERVAQVESGCGKLPGLWVGGNALRGVSLSDCAADALATAERLLGRELPAASVG